MQVGDSCIVWTKDGKTWTDTLSNPHEHNREFALCHNAGKAKTKANSVVRVKEIKYKQHRHIWETITDSGGLVDACSICGEIRA